MKDKASGVKNTIAERRLLYSEKGSDVRKALTIRIGAPYVVSEVPGGPPVEDEFAGCSIELDGIAEEVPDVYGTDRLQALFLAANIEPLLERLRKKYDFFWPSGEAYFEGDDS